MVKTKPKKKKALYAPPIVPVYYITKPDRTGFPALPGVNRSA